MKRLAALFLLLLVAACKPDDPRFLWIVFGTYNSTPVVITDVRVNGRPVYHFPLIAHGADDVARPRIGGTGTIGFDYPAGKTAGMMHLSADWVELLTHRAYHVEADVALDKLQRGPNGTASMMPVFGPNGLFLLTSDPAPTAAGDSTEVNLLRRCAPPAPGKDRDFTKDSTLNGLPEALALSYPPVKNPECPAPGK